MANTPIYLLLDVEASGAQPWHAEVRSLATPGTVAETISLSEAAPRLWTGLVAEQLSGDFVLTLYEDGAERGLSNSHTRFLVNLRDTTDLHFATDMPPERHLADTREVLGDRAWKAKGVAVYPGQVEVEQP